MKFRYILILSIFVFLSASNLKAQDVDSTLVGSNVLSTLESKGKVVVNQDATIKNALSVYISEKSKSTKRGYRIFVYSSNNQNARNVSAGVASGLEGEYPGHKVYRAYHAPVWSVQIGNFRSKSDAMKIYSQIVQKYPAAKIIKTRIDWYTF